MKISWFSLLFFMAVNAMAQTHPESPLQVSFATSNYRYAQDKAPQVTQQNEWSATAWKGEKVHTQLVVWTTQDIPRLSIGISDLVSDKGNKINAAQVQTGFLRYVMTDEFDQGCGYRTSTNFDSSWVADMIDPAATTAVKKNTTQPVWISVSVPAGAEPGKYKGTVIVNAGKKVMLNITLQVQDHLLPPPADWAFDLDLWQHPAAIARVHNLKLWSQEHFDKMRPYYTMLANAGQKVITASIMNEPWGHQTYDDFPSLVKWIKKKDGSWQYDYSLFDK